MNGNDGRKGFWKSLTTPSAKYSVLALLVVGVVVGAAMVIGTQVMVSATGTNEFCGTACHEMQTALKELEESSHGRNKIGVTASCHDCHIPHNYPANLIHKAYAGAKDVYHHLLGTLNTPEKYEKNRARMAKAELERLKSRDSAECRHCHDAVKMDLAKQTKYAAKSHKEAAEKKETCVECHTGVAHKEAEEEQSK
ncbi:MAG TPA: NapC/NirT family cytochrome c [Burkholderiales bacterium]|nr:NapC/NirT family cytochrome c [Burkholderiales bacterium]